MATLTPILGLSKPIVGADDDVWGGMWNANADILDTLVKPIDLAPYLLKAGGTMTGPLTLSANAVNALHAVPFQQLNSGLATKIGDAPNDGAYYARRNLGWEVSPGSAITTDAPSDNFAYGRRNASWSKTLMLAGGTMTGDIVLKGDATAALNPVSLQQLNTTAGAYLPLTGGVVAGATTINGNVFAASTGHITGMGKTVVPGDAIGAWAQFQEIALGYNNGHIAFNAYVGSGPAWKALAAGYAANIYLAPAGNLSITLYGTVAAAGAALTGAGSFDFQQGGNFQASGAVTAVTSVASGTHIYCGGTLLINPANSWEWYFAVSGGNHIQNHRANWYDLWDGGNGTRSWYGPNGGLMTLDGNGTLTVKGYLYCIGAGRVDGTWQANGITSLGDVQANGNATTNNHVISYAGRLQAQNAGEPCVFLHRPGAFAAGMLLNANSQLIIANMSGAGGWQATWVTITDSLLTVPYDISSGRNMSTGGLYCGNLVNSGNTYANGYFVGGNGNTNYGFYVQGGTGDRVWQNSAGWYWQWQSNSGDIWWYAGGAATWRMRQGGDYLTWNQTAAVGGVGAYQNYSDRRSKRDIEPTEIGLPEILKLQPVRFTRIWKPELITGRKLPDGRPIPDIIPRSEIGFIAQDVRGALPDAVVEVNDFTGEGSGAGFAMTYDSITTALVNAVKTLNARLVKLEGRH